jgi:sorbose reductase
MEGKVVAVTGAADGIGFAVAEAMAEAGANLALWYNTNDVAIAKAAQLQDKYRIKATAYRVDVSDYIAVEKTVKKVVTDFGKLDVFVANAGMAISKAITEQTVEEYKKQMVVNGTLS